MTQFVQKGMVIKMDKISSMQFMTILICSKLFCIMTYMPENQKNGALFIITIIVGTVLLGLLMLPSVTFYNKNNGEGILSFASSKSRALAIIISLIYLIVSLVSIIKVMGNISFFLKYNFSETYAPWAVVIVISLAAFYISQLGISTLARTTGIIVVTTFIGLFVVLCGFDNQIDFSELNLAVEHPVSTVIGDIPTLLANSYELVAFALLLNSLKSKPSKTIFSYLIIRMIIIVITILAVTLILGDYAYLSKLPFFSLSSYSQTKIFEHFKAFFMLFWSLCAIIKIVLFTICAGLCINEILPKINPSVSRASALIISAATAIPLLMMEKWENLKLINFQAVIIFISFFVIPLIMLMFKKRNVECQGG